MPESRRSAPTSRAFEPVKTHRTFEIICQRIRDELAAGTLKVGDKLPSEREMALQFQVSRTALREALRSLEVAGIIRNIKGGKGGAVIQAADPDRIAQAMRDYFSRGSISLDELTEARIALQDVIVRLVCSRASDSDIKTLELIAEKTMKADGVEARYECAVEFYAALAHATRNQVFGILTHSLSSLLHDFVKGPGYETLQESLFQSRLRLVEYLRRREEEKAAEEMRQHLQRIHEHVEKNLKKRKPKPKRQPLPQ